MQNDTLTYILLIIFMMAVFFVTKSTTKTICFVCDRYNTSVTSSTRIFFFFVSSLSFLFQFEGFHTLERVYDNKINLFC